MNRKRQSLKNSGVGLPSKACPTNWKTQPVRNNPTAIFQNPRMNGAISKSGIESAIIGIPNVWNTRLTGSLWLASYRAIQSSIERSPKIG
jgi:hypothetical protein